jgi:hypothetical protein
VKRLWRLAGIPSLLRALVADVADERAFTGLVCDEQLSRFVCGQELCFAQSTGQPKSDGDGEWLTFQGYGLIERAEMWAVKHGWTDPDVIHVRPI